MTVAWLQKCSAYTANVSGHIGRAIRNVGGWRTALTLKFPKAVSSCPNARETAQNWGQSLEYSSSTVWGGDVCCVQCHGTALPMSGSLVSDEVWLTSPETHSACVWNGCLCRSSLYIVDLKIHFQHHHHCRNSTFWTVGLFRKIGLSIPSRITPSGIHFFWFRNSNFDRGCSAVRHTPDLKDQVPSEFRGGPVTPPFPLPSASRKAAVAVS
jgi:hypothetical protein